MKVCLLNDYMFLTTTRFKFLDVKNFPYEWFDSYEKLSYVGPVGYEDFNSIHKPTITKD